MAKEADRYLQLLLLQLLSLCVQVHAIEHFLTANLSIGYYYGDEHLQQNFMELLRHVRYGFDYDHIVVWRENNRNSSCIFDSLIKEAVFQPFMVTNHNSRMNVLSKNHNTLTLILSCYEKFVSIESAEHRASEYPFRSCHLVWVKNSNQQAHNVCSTLIDSVTFRHFIIDRKSLEKQFVYACNSNETMEISFAGIRDHMQMEFSYMKDLPIVTESDQLPPRSILYQDNSGKLQLDGNVGHCVTTFAHRYGAKLFITPPLQLKKNIFYEVLANKTFAGLIDLPAVTIPLKPNSFDEKYSYPLDVLDYCYMIPLPHLMETFRVFTYIIEAYVLICIIVLSFVYGALLTIGTEGRITRLALKNIFMNDKSIRGLLGQSFVMPANPTLFLKYVCLLLCYTSLIIAATYNAFLQSNLIQPGFSRKVETYEDMRAAGLKIAISSNDLKLVPSADYLLFRDLFKVLPSFDSFIKLRATMDTRYAYPVATSRWEVFKQQQEFFQRPLFYFSTNMCLIKFALLSVPFGPNLPYKALFNQHLLDVRDTGLLQYWINDSFHMMVRLKYKNFSVLSIWIKDFSGAIKFNDFKWIWMLYASFNALSFIVFIGEKIAFHYKVSPKYRPRIVVGQQRNMLGCIHHQ